MNDNGKATHTVTLRYYEDMPHVAYIGVSDFEVLLSPNRSVRVDKTAASQYQLTTNKGKTAKVNTADESMAFDDYMGFVSIASMEDDDEQFYVRPKPM